MKKIFFIFLLIFLFACTQQTPEGEEIATDCPPSCSGGSAAVTSTINSPQNEGNVYVGDRLAISMNLIDSGESSVEDGLVCITGLDGETFSGLGGCNCESFYITIDDSDDANFERTTVDFPSAYINPQASGTQHITFYTRYSYTSYAPFTLCLTGDPYNEESCSVDGNKVTSSSSGPLQVSSITEEITTEGGNAITLRLHVQADLNSQNTAQMIELNEVSEDTCLLLNTDEKTQGDISVILFGESYDCGKITFDQGEEEAEVTCKIKNIDTQGFIGGENDFDGWVRIDYGYQEIQSVSFDVVSGS